MVSEYTPDRRAFLKAFPFIPMAVYATACGRSPTSGVSVGRPRPVYSDRQLTHLKEYSPQQFGYALLENLESMGYEVHPGLRRGIESDLVNRLNKPIVLENNSASDDGSLSRHGMSAAKPVVRDLATKAAITNARSSFFDVRDIGNGVVEYWVKIEAPGYLLRETKGFADKGAPIRLDEVLVPDDPELIAMMDDTSRRALYLDYENKIKKVGSLRWKKKPKIYISTSDEFLRTAKISDDAINYIVRAINNQMVLWTNGFAKNTEIEIGDGIPLKPGTEYEIQEGYIFVRFTVETPGLGAAAVWDDNKDGWVEKSYVGLRPPAVADANYTGTILQELATAYGAEAFPRNPIIKPDNTMLHQWSILQDFTNLDIKHGNWLYSRPALNRHPDKDEGWELDINQIPVTGDFNRDNYVNFSDFLIFAPAFGSDPSKPNWNEQADLTGDGKIAFDDFLLFAQNFGRKRDQAQFASKS